MNTDDKLINVTIVTVEELINIYDDLTMQHKQFINYITPIFGNYYYGNVFYGFFELQPLITGVENSFFRQFMTIEEISKFKISNINKDAKVVFLNDQWDNIRFIMYLSKCQKEFITDYYKEIVYQYPNSLDNIV